MTGQELASDLPGKDSFKASFISLYDDNSNDVKAEYKFISSEYISEMSRWLSLSDHAFAIRFKISIFVNR